jgi:hypothetical protein
VVSFSKVILVRSSRVGYLPLTHDLQSYACPELHQWHN